jgi:hypothetical protein
MRSSEVAVGPVYDGQFDGCVVLDTETVYTHLWARGKETIIRPAVSGERIGKRRHGMYFRTTGFLAVAIPRELNVALRKRIRADNAFDPQYDPQVLELVASARAAISEGGLDPRVVQVVAPRYLQGELAALQRASDATFQVDQERREHQEALRVAAQNRYADAVYRASRLRVALNVHSTNWVEPRVPIDALKRLLSLAERGWDTTTMEEQ